MAVKFQLVVDCSDSDRMVEFWAAALGYVPEPPPDAFDSWYAYWLDMGVDAAEIEGVRVDSIVDPDGRSPRIWFQVVGERKTLKNRLHIDIGASGGRGLPIEQRRANVDREAARLVDLGATLVGVLEAEGLDHYAVAMTDPEGNEFDVN